MKFLAFISTIIFLCFTLAEVDGSEVVYYWKDYSGKIPSDAVPSGLDLNNETTYIGQGFVSDVGIIPGVIYPGKNEIAAPDHGVKKVDTYIKILCSPHQNAFKWIPVTDKDFQIKTINKYLVRGGVERNNLLFIGRIAFQGELVTGKVVTNSSDYPDSAPMFFVYKNEEHKASTYEVLIYDDDRSNKIDVRTE